MRDPFTNFHLDTENIPLAKEQRVTISIEGLYANGRGYIVNPNTYELDVYPKFRDAGYKIVEPEDKFGCPTLQKKGTKMSLYMHPEGYTGYASNEDINKVRDILASCPLVSEARLHFSQTVYDMNDFDYKRLLIKNSKAIISEIKDYLDKGGFVHSSELGFDFARNARIERIGDSSGVLFSDTDVQVISDIFLTAVELGEFDGYPIKKDEKSRVSINGKEKNKEAVTPAPNTGLSFEEFVPASEKVNGEESAVVPGFGQIFMDIYVSADQTNLLSSDVRYDCVLSSNVSKPPIVFSCTFSKEKGVPNLIDCFSMLMAKAEADRVTGIEKPDLQRFFGEIALEDIVYEANHSYSDFLTDYTVEEGNLIESPEEIDR